MTNLNSNNDQISCYSLPKVKADTESIQDACQYNQSLDLLAISDGVSTSFYPKDWAITLVNSFCVDDNSALIFQKKWKQWLSQLQQQYTQKIIDIKSNPKLPWYVKGSSAKDCASATFIGLKLFPQDIDERSEKAAWKAIAVGDSCLFHYQAKTQNLNSFPILKSKDFRTVTTAFHSLAEFNDKSDPKYTDGSYEPEDVFLLATDALAKWILSNKEQNQTRWKELLFVQTEEDFRSLIEELRSKKDIDNDDTSILKIRIKKQSRIKPALVSIPAENTSSIEPEDRIYSTSDNSDRNNMINEQSINTSQTSEGLSNPTAGNNLRQDNVRHLLSNPFAWLIIIPILCNFLVSSSLLYIAFKLNQENEEIIGLTNELTKNFNELKKDLQNNDVEQIPLYRNAKNDREVAYLYKKSEDFLASENNLFSVHIPRSSIDTDKESFTSNSELPLYIRLDLSKEKNGIQYIVIGRLLPGEYKYVEAKNSSFNKNDRWVKVQLE